MRSCSPSHLITLSETCNSVSHLKHLHALLIRRPDLPTPLTLRILAKLLRFAAVSPAGDLNYAAALFHHHLPTISTTPTAAPFFYNTLARGYAHSPTPSLALPLFTSMLRRSLRPDPFSFTFLLKSLSRSPHYSAEPSHPLALKSGCLAAHPSHLHVHNALIALYASRALPALARQVLDEMPTPDVVSWSALLTAHLNARNLNTARSVFDAMPARDVVSWTAMIAGYARAKRPRDALALFRAMPVPPDEVTMVGVVSACAAAADLEACEDVHRYINAQGFGWMVSLRNALVDMYAKCGCLRKAKQVFDGTPQKSRVSWNAMITAYATHGDAAGAIALFDRMVVEARSGGVTPDGVTLLAVLSACAHDGRVEEGRKVFEAMRQEEYGRAVESGVEHYGCMVDLLGRAGLLEEAYRLIENMPVPSNDVVWGALLGACRIHGDVEMAELAVVRLLQLKPEEGGYYILLSSMYAESGRQEEAMDVRLAMRKRGANKTPGCSSTATPP